MVNDFEHYLENDNIYIHYKKTTLNSPVDFILHEHTHPEIYIFISGNATFLYEGTTYNLEPLDIMVIPPYVMHQPIPNIQTSYTRYVLYPLPEFYTNFTFASSYDIFKNTTAQNAKIPNHIVKQTDIINILNKIGKYSNNYQQTDIPVANHLFYEILYILNSITEYETYNTKNVVVQEIIGYINDNYKFIQTIDEISVKLGYSTSYISSLFKKYTGITIHEYIIKKRLNNTKLLYQSGENLTSACLNSGFSSYNNFAYTYKKLYGKSPKFGFKE